MPVVAGIDLGITNSCIAVYKNGSVKIVETKDGNKTIPSCVYYEKNGTIIVGEEARKKSALIAENGIYDSKRLIGIKFEDILVQENLKHWPFDVTKGKKGECEIKMTQNDGELRIRPEEVSGAILAQLKENLEKEMDDKIVNVVITVPAYFNVSQKEATKDAARIAGLNVLKLQQEPTAAALAFAQGNKVKKDRTILVYDLGGGTFDVSLLKCYGGNGKIKVLAVGGDQHLGGRDFDQRLYNHILEQIEKKYNLSMDSMHRMKQRRFKRRLKEECEGMKKMLSESTTADFELYEFGDKSIQITVSRETFENITRDLFRQTIDTLDQIFSGKVDKNKIDEVLLVGGSTKIPKVQELIRNYFGGKELNKTVNPDEAVAIGAAYSAALLSDDVSQKLKDCKLSDVTSHSLGIEVVGEKNMSVLIEKNQRIPCVVENTYYTVTDYQRETVIRVFEGGADNVENNNLLGEFTVGGITPKPRGAVKIFVKFQLDDDGILKVTATENSKNISKSLNIVLVNMRLTSDEIGRAFRRVVSVYSVKADDDFD